MKQYIQLYENWQSPQTITLKSPIKGKIVIEIEHGRIVSIKNNTGLTPTFIIGQPAQPPFIKGWARENGFTVSDSKQSDDTLIAGIKSKYLQKYDPIRFIKPNKFRGY